MSALPPKADIAESDWHVRFVPKADSCTAAKNLSGPGLPCIRLHEPSALPSSRWTRLRRDQEFMPSLGTAGSLGSRPLERPFFWRCFGALSQARRHNSGREEVFSNVLEH